MPALAGAICFGPGRVWYDKHKQITDVVMCTANGKRQADSRAVIGAGTRLFRSYRIRVSANHHARTHARARGFKFNTNNTK